jgi:hypothetical protein
MRTASERRNLDGECPEKCGIHRRAGLALLERDSSFAISIQSNAPGKTSLRRRRLASLQDYRRRPRHPAR